MGSWFHDDVIKKKNFPRYWPFVRGIHRSPVNSPHESQWRGALMFSLISARINGWVNNREAGDLRRYHLHDDVIVMFLVSCNNFRWMRGYRYISPPDGRNVTWILINAWFWKRFWESLSEKELLDHDIQITKTPPFQPLDIKRKPGEVEPLTDLSSYGKMTLENRFDR